MIPPVIRDGSLPNQGLNGSGTISPSQTNPLTDKRTPVAQVVSTQTPSQVPSVFSEEAKQKFEKDVQTLKFVRKVQALSEDTTRQARVEELKAQFKTTEGLNGYLNTLDTDTIAKNILDHKVL